MKTKGKQKEESPTVQEVVAKWMTPGTMLGRLEYPEKPIIFKNSKLSPVKSLQVNIRSTETSDMAALHKLHTQTRTS